MNTSTRFGLPRRASTVIGLMCLIGSFFPQPSRGDEAQCGALRAQGQFGPFDYREKSRYKDEFYLVESAHFTRGVETLTQGNSGPLGGDLDYTLRAIPNHHLALRSMMRYYTEKVDPPRPPMRYSADCYFDRAVRMAPDDAVVWVLKGMYAIERGRTQEALDSLGRAAALAPDDAEVQYNLGLLYLRLNKRDEALKHAQVAYERGFPLPGLRQRLQALGIWREAAKGTQ